MRLGDQGAHLGALERGVADGDTVHRRLEQREEALVDGALDEDARAGTAVLAGVVEHAVGGSGRGQLEVGVGEDDVGALAAELEGDPLDLLGAARHHTPTDLGGAGEAHLAHGGVGHEALADDAALAGQDLQDALGQPGLERQLADAQRAQRRQLGRLDHDRVAGGQRRCEAPARDRHGEVPGHDDGHHTERLVEGHVEASGHGDLPAALPLRGRRVVLEHVAHVPGLPACVPDHVAGVRHLQVGQLVEVRVDGGGEAPEQPGPLPGREVPPGLEGGGRPRDGGVGLLGGQPLDLGDDLSGGWVADVHGLIFADGRPQSPTGSPIAPSRAEARR